MQTILHKNDLSNGINFSNIIAADCEMMGLQPNRDPLCLIQLYDGKGDCHLVQFIDQNFDAPNLKKLLSSDKTFIFHYARHDLAAIKHDLNIMIKNVYCTKISSKIARTYSQGHGYKDLCKELLNIDISKKKQSSDWSNPNLSKEQNIPCRIRSPLSNSSKFLAQQKTLNIMVFFIIILSFFITMSCIKLTKYAHNVVSTPI